MWISSNILAGPPDNIQRCMETGLLSWILEVLLDIESVQNLNKDQYLEHVEIQNEAIYALSNTTMRASEDQLIVMINDDMVGALCIAFRDIFKFNILIPLKAIEKLLEFGDNL